MEKLHIWLPSNVKSDPNNTTAEYTTRLPNTLRLDGKWECGLAEVSFTKSFTRVTITKPQVVGLMRLYKGERVALVHKFAIILAGDYSNVHLLVDLVNKYFRKYYAHTVNFKEPNLMIDTESKRVTYEHGLYRPFFGDELTDIFGLEVHDVDAKFTVKDGEWDFSDTSLFPELAKDLVLQDEQVHIKVLSNFPLKDYSTADAVKPCDLNGGIRNFFIYTNIIEPMIVGDIYAPLLRTVQVPGDRKPGEQIDILFEEIYFIPISIREISTINIAIKDSLGNLIPFNFGRTILHLILRKTE
jgi:hypothetical protein